VTSAYEDFVATGQMSFRLRDGAKRLGDVVTWRWEGVSPDGEVLGAGLEFVIPGARLLVLEQAATAIPEAAAGAVAAAMLAL
jgi:hypothetical protein